MALFQNQNAPESALNYKGMSKDQLIMLLNSQQSDIEILNHKLNSAATAVDEKNRLAQQVASLTAENEALKAQAADLSAKLAAEAEKNSAPKNFSPKETEIKEIGSIAELSFRVNGVMEAAQKAADDYLARIKEMYDEMSKEYSDYEINAKQKADTILRNANAEATVIRQNARTEANDIWNTLQSRFDSYVANKKLN